MSSRQEAAAWEADAGERRAWWLAATAPLLFWRKLRLGWLPAGVAVVAVAAGLGLLAWGLVRTQEEGSPELAVVSEPGVYLIKADGSGLRRLPGAGRARDVFAWAPSGNRFALVPGCQAEDALFLGTADSDEPQKISMLPSDAFSIFWSPREDTLAVNLSRGAGIAAGAALLDVNDGTVSSLDDAISFSGWSHDGRWYAMSVAGTDNLDGIGATTVDTETGQKTYLGDGIREILWSPNDHRLAFSQVQGPEEPPYNAWLASGVGVMNADGSGREVLLEMERHSVTGAASAVTWSPDGERLLLKPGTSPFHYLVYDVDTLGQPLDFGETYKLSGGAWSPDGEHIAVERGRPDGGILIAVFPANGGNGIEVSAGAAAQHPQFSPDSQHIVFVARRTGDWDAQDLYLADTDDGVPIMLSEVGMTIFDAAWSADGTYIEFTAGPVTADGCGDVGGTMTSPPV